MNNELDHTETLMNDMDNQQMDPSDEAYQERRAARLERLKKRKRGILLMRLFVLLAILAVIALGVLFFRGTISLKGIDVMKPVRSVQQFWSEHFPSKKETKSEQQTETARVTEVQTEAAPEPATEVKTEVSATIPPSVESAGEMEKAALLAAGYDYDQAISVLEAIPDYETDQVVLDAIASYETAKAECVPVDVYSVPHIFYHSLLNDTDRAFNVSVLGQFAVDGMNAWMTTIDEFDRITQKLYDAGYVYVRLRDLVIETKNEDGSVSFTANDHLMLPPGKKAIVLSVDDLSYYHSYEAAGFPEKLVLDESGKVKCLYTDSSGTARIGDFDVVPRLNTFLEEHPDGSYHGARGLIAMTGYNGVFGYRTDKDYELREHLMEDQAKWLENHPDFNRQTEIEEATKIADAIKAEGWEFASHTWGHLSVTEASVERLRTDNEKWVENVQNIVGPVDTIIFAHGNDIGSWEGYSADNEQYAYYKSAGYNFYCNVDGSVPYWVQIADQYVRQGRIDLDGYMLYQSSIGATTVLDHMFKASEVFDSRRPTPVVANGQA